MNETVKVFRRIAAAQLANFIAALLPTFALSPGSTTQATYVVDDTMATGADFPDMISAYNAAVSGDRILVRVGSGAGYLFPLNFNEGLTILGIGMTKPQMRFPYTIMGCPAGELLVFDNLEFVAASRQSGSTGIAYSAGTIVMSRLSYPAAGNYPILVYQSHRVFFTDCDIVSPRPTIQQRSTDEVFVLNCRTFSGSGYGYDSERGSISVLNGGTLWLVGGTHQGGDGYDDCFFSYSPHAAVSLQQGRGILSGPAILRGGRYMGPCGDGSSWGSFTDNCAPGSNGTAIDPMINVGTEPFRCPLNFNREMPAIIAGPAARGQTQNLDVWGPRQSVVAVFASLMHPYDPIRLPIGDVWLDPGLMLHVGTGAVDAQRHLLMTTTIPSWLEHGTVLVYQAVSMNPQSQFEISTPGMAVVH